MTRPVTTLDERYSEPDAAATEWDETCRVLESAEVFWISTGQADGRPHVTPCAAVWLDGTIYLTPAPPSRRPST
jgi:nitroimidazol reductase NimA-like FMN-containing flavoprotein (pyridoxamine 5'-phosphate oxidase superfamily)